MLLSAVILQLFACPLLTDRFFPQSGTARFPNSLKEIGAESFEGTAFRILFFQDGFRQLGENAFKGTDHLEMAYFPRSTVYVASSAFTKSNIGLICGAEGSYIQKWAEENGVAFRCDYDWLTAPKQLHFSAEVLLAVFALLCLPPMSETKRIRQYLHSVSFSMRPQDRPELNPIDYRFP